MVDGAFNDLHGAESEWKKLGHARTPKARLADAHYAMYRLYLRLGRYRQAVAAHWFGADGEVTKDAMLLPELRFKLGAFPVVLHESPALLFATIPQSERYEGQLGMDAMAQAAELTYDLRAMKMTLK